MKADRLGKTGSGKAGIWQCVFSGFGVGRVPRFGKKVRGDAFRSPKTESDLLEL